MGTTITIAMLAGAVILCTGAIAALMRMNDKLLRQLREIVEARAKLEAFMATGMASIAGSLRTLARAAEQGAPGAAIATPLSEVADAVQERADLLAGIRKGLDADAN